MRRGKIERWLSHALEAARAARRYGPSGALRYLRAAKLQRQAFSFPQGDQYLPSSEAIREMRHVATTLTDGPTISVLLPLYNTPEPFLRECLDSVINQIYPHWELCIADDASRMPHVAVVLREYCALDRRIKVVMRPTNGHISAASNSALELVTGEYVALLDHDDLLAPHALLEVARFMRSHPEIDLLYSDEDKVDIAGAHSEPCFKAGWSPAYFRSFMYIGHLSVYRTEVLRAIGGFRVGMEGSQDYDCALRAVNRGVRVAHLPGVLYHWRAHPESVAQNIAAKPYAFEAGLRALNDAAKSLAPGMIVEPTRLMGISRLRGAEGTARDIDVVLLPVDEAADYQAPDSVASVSRKRAAGEPFEVDAVRCVDFSSVDGLRGFLTRAAGAGSAPFVALVDPRLRCFGRSLTHGIGALRELIDQPGVGAVAGKVVSPDRFIINAGYLVDRARLVRNLYGVFADRPGYGVRALAVRDTTAAPLECILVRRDILNRLCALPLRSAAALEAGLALIIAGLGLRIVWTPFAEFEYSDAWPEREVDLRSLGDDYARLLDLGLNPEQGDPLYPPLLSSERLDYSFGDI